MYAGDEAKKGKKYPTGWLTFIFKYIDRFSNESTRLSRTSVCKAPKSNN